MLHCKDVTTLIGTEGLADAGRLTRLRVRMHLLWCRHCQAYVRSLQQLAALARRVASAEIPSKSGQDEAVLEVVRRAIANTEEASGA